MRAYRPSRFSSCDEYEEDNTRIKQANILVYKVRARLKRALFDFTGGSDQSDAGVSISEQRN